ncbi:MAG TPA: Crp/Fnr family transcriptional regulator [Myxococcales bacterium LLY-WYZ-16_1]|jgi:CRP/FNR family transcriptional regulator, cyclic AMP receptor protein|nr:Crp/Fnr family transcriptional regulator [Myxococcales bacterium LLY-WYZ-16_1]
MSAYTDLLRNVSLFRNVREEELDRLAALMTERDVPKDAHIVTQSEPGDAMFVIAKGRVKVVIYGDNGREVILTLLKTGEFFGEMALLDDLPRSANVIASEDSTVLMLRREQFADFVEKNPPVALNVMAELSRRLRRADEIIGNLATLDVYGRVAHIMIDLAKKDGVETEEGILIKEKPTQQDIASMIGTSRETVSRVLSEFQRRGFVEMRGREILLSRRFAGIEGDPVPAESEVPADAT